MKKMVNILVLIAVVIYAVSPVDLAPGPVDDMIMFVICFIAKRRHFTPAAVSDEGSTAAANTIADRAEIP